MEKIGYLGPEGSYSHIAAKKIRPDAKLCAYPSFPLVMASLKDGSTDAIVIPIENTLNGGVLQNIDLLQDTDGVVAVEECTVRIDHRLATLKGADKNKIKRIFSHSQALEQCAKYLFERYPSAQLIPSQSTAASLEKVVSEEDACIVGAHMQKSGVVLSEYNIADEGNNFTHFLLVKRGKADTDAQTDRIYFSVTCPNKSGALLALLQRIAKHGLNMTKIQSRPVKNAPDEYRFFIETEGDYSRSEVRYALEDVKKAAISFKLLGCYKAE